MDVAGAVAIVTGAAAGSGRSVALRLAAEGAAVVVADVDQVGLRETALLVAEAGGRVALQAADMTVVDDVTRLVDSAVATFGGLQILVNNAGGGGATPPHFPDATLREWGALLDLNLRGPMLATHLALAPLQAAGGGAVINVASSAGLPGGPITSPEYATAKAGLIRFTATLAPLHRRMGVRVTCVVPEWLGTERAFAELAAMTDEQRQDAGPPIPLDVFDDAVLGLIADDMQTGRSLLLPQRGPPRFLD